MVGDCALWSHIVLCWHGLNIYSGMDIKRVCFVRYRTLSSYTSFRYNARTRVEPKPSIVGGFPNYQHYDGRPTSVLFTPGHEQRRRKYPWRNERHQTKSQFAIRLVKATCSEIYRHRSLYRTANGPVSVCVIQGVRAKVRETSGSYFMSHFE